jgi:hypothetical protein
MNELIFSNSLIDYPDFTKSLSYMKLKLRRFGTTNRFCEQIYQLVVSMQPCRKSFRWPLEVGFGFVGSQGNGWSGSI